MVPRREKLSSIHRSLITDHKLYYDKMKGNLSELQPIAFLITASLAVAAFLGGDFTKQQYAIAASFAFLLAYMGLHAYKLLNEYVYFYWALVLLTLGIISLYLSFGDVISKIQNMDRRVELFLYLLLQSVFFVINLSLLLKADPSSERYNVSKSCFYIAIPLSVLALPFDIYFYSNAFTFIASRLLPFVLFFLSAILLISNQQNQTKNHKRL